MTLVEVLPAGQDAFSDADNVWHCSEGELIMNRDAWMLTLWLGMPILIGSFATLMMLLGRRARSIICPNCGRRFPKSAITRQGVHCHHCDWRLSVKEPGYSDFRGKP